MLVNPAEQDRVKLLRGIRREGQSLQVEPVANGHGFARHEAEAPLQFEEVRGDGRRAGDQHVGITVKQAGAPALGCDIEAVEESIVLTLKANDMVDFNAQCSVKTPTDNPCGINLEKRLSAGVNDIVSFRKARKMTGDHTP